MDILFKKSPLTYTLLRTITENEAHVIWIDNFSKLYRTRMIELDKHTLQSLLWTGIAVKRFAYPAEVSDAVMRDFAGLIIPAVSSDPFKHVQQLLLLLLDMTQDKEGDFPRLLSNSLMIAWDVKTVPLQPVVAKMHSSLRPAVLAGYDRMSNFYPLGMSRENIGSNEGLSKIMRKIYIDAKMNLLTCARYTTLSVDVNIYDRILKVCRSTSISRSQSLT